MNLFFNASSSDPASALVRDETRNTPAAKPVFTLGDNPEINLYVTDGSGGYDADSGSASVTPWLGIGTPGGEPDDGTWWLGVSSATSGALTNGSRYYIQDYQAGDDFTNVGATVNETGAIFTKNNGSPTDWTHGSTLVEITADLAHDATAAAIQSALIATHEIAADALAVTKPGSALVFSVQWAANGAQSLLIGGGSNLSPASAVVVSRVATGSSSVKERQLVRLTRQPAALQTTWAQISNGWNARLDCNTEGLLDLLNGAESVGSKLELQLVDGSGNIRTVGQVECLIRNEAIDEESTIPAPLPSYLTSAQVRAEATATTTNSTQTTLTYTVGSGTLDANSTVAFFGIVTARRTDADGENDGFEFKGIIYRDATAASTTLVALQMNQLGATAWSVDVQADTTNGAILIKVTGATSKTISWKAHLYKTAVAE
jgi:hypothetical protein